jgi:hypothetical protein
MSPISKILRDLLTRLPVTLGRSKPKEGQLRSVQRTSQAICMDRLCQRRESGQQRKPGH